jgi:hypothetical protein
MIMRVPTSYAPRLCGGPIRQRPTHNDRAQAAQRCFDHLSGEGLTKGRTLSEDAIAAPARTNDISCDPIMPTPPTAASRCRYEAFSARCSGFRSCRATTRPSPSHSVIARLEFWDIKA